MNGQLLLAHPASGADRRPSADAQILAAGYRWQPATILARGISSWPAAPSSRAGENPDLTSRDCGRGLYRELRQMSFA